MTGGALGVDVERPAQLWPWRAAKGSCNDFHDRYTHLFPSEVETLVGRLEDIRARSLAAQPRPKDRSRGIELGGR